MDGEGRDMKRKKAMRPYPRLSKFFAPFAIIILEKYKKTMGMDASYCIILLRMISIRSAL